MVHAYTVRLTVYCTFDNLKQLTVNCKKFLFALALHLILSFKYMYMHSYILRL